MGRVERTTSYQMRTANAVDAPNDLPATPEAHPG